MMWVPDQQLRAFRGGSATLRCVVESHPEALTFWNHGGRIVQPGGKFFMSESRGKPSYKVKSKMKEYSNRIGGKEESRSTNVSGPFLSG